MGKRKTLPIAVKTLVLHEAGYKCANPVCRHVLTLDVHHLEYLSEGGSDTPENLLPLCPNCHALHHKGEIPMESLRTWKMFLISLNEAYDRKSVDILLALDKQQAFKRMTGDGIIGLASLVASGLVRVREYYESEGTGIMYKTYQVYLAELTDKGKLFVDNWKKGDQQAAVGQEPVLLEDNGR